MSVRISGPSRAIAHLRTNIRPISFTVPRRCLNASSPKAPPRLAFAFDIDGVLKQGEHILPQAKRVLSLLSGKPGHSASPVPFLLMTNGGGMPDAERCAALSKDFDIEIGPNQLVQSHTPLRDYVSSYADSPVLVVGGKGSQARRIAESYGLKQAYLLQDMVAWNHAVWDRYTLSPEEESFVKRDVDFSQIPIQAIFIVHDGGMDWSLATQVITELLSSDSGRMGTRRKEGSGGTAQLPVVLTNPDVLWGSDYPLPRLGMGAFRIALEAVYKETTGKTLQYTQFGKPHTATYDFAEAMLRRRLKELGQSPGEALDVYMVGDNPESDIAGANAHGWNSLLVKTGVYQEGEPRHRPTRIVDDVEQGVHWAIERQLSSGKR